MNTTEQQIAAALSARTRGITMDTIELQDRFAEVRERGARSQARRRRTMVGAAALGTAAAALGAFALVAGVPGQDEPVPFAQREKAVLGEPSLVGIGTLPDAPTLTVEPVPYPFTFEPPAADDRQGTWRYNTGEPGPQGRDPVFGVGIDARTRSGADAGVEVAMPAEVYAPGRPWTEQDALVPAPTDADGWADWLEDTGLIEITDREDLEIGGLSATRFEVSVDELPDQYVGCSPNRACVALLPVTNPVIGTARVGAGNQVGFGPDVAEVTVVELGERAAVITAFGEPDQREQWLPQMRSIIESIRFA